jgi:DNA processing protein
VGSRNASPAGLATARDFAATLARAGLCIVSGLATGIDSAAHAAALDAGGRTVAVCATGLDIVYPASNAALARRIRAQGALVSEFALGVEARAHHFPRRNRIIAALSLGTLVVEAGLRSGSLITARLATENGRDVFAIPGSIHHPLARGCHRLIRDGAKLVESAAEVLEELAPMLGALRFELDPAVAASSREPEDSASARLGEPDYARLLAALGHDSLGVDELVARTALAASAVASMLSILELEEVVSSCPGGRFQRLPGRGSAERRT